MDDLSTESHYRATKCQLNINLIPQGVGAYNLLHISELLVAGNCNGLDQELVAASGVERWLRFHRLQKDWNVC